VFFLGTKLVLSVGMREGIGLGTSGYLCGWFGSTVLVVSTSGMDQVVISLSSPLESSAPPTDLIHDLPNANLEWLRGKGLTDTEILCLISVFSDDG